LQHRDNLLPNQEDSMYRPRKILISMIDRRHYLNSPYIDEDLLDRVV